MGRVMITGATGFTGSHIAREFRRHNVRVGCLVRENSDISNINDLLIDLPYGDVLDLKSLRTAFRHYDFVIHNAAYARSWGEYEKFNDVNIEGTLNVMRACLEEGIKRVMITSSAYVYGEMNCRRVKDERWPHDPYYRYFSSRVFPSIMNYYRGSKSIAEKEAIEFAKKYDMDLTIMQPVQVYGEGDFHSDFYRYLKALSRGVPFMPGSSRSKSHVIYVRDLARAYYMAYEKNLEGINAFIVGNEKAEKTDRIYSLFCAAAGYRKPKSLPKSFVYPAAFITELIYAVLNKKEPPFLTRDRVNRFYDNVEFSVQKAYEILGFKNEYSLEEGIRRTVEYYRNEKLRTNP